ncbi:MAG: hypothetical protein ABIZ04_16175 [Opitutus sp.]
MTPAETSHPVESVPVEAQLWAEALAQELNLAHSQHTDATAEDRAARLEEVVRTAILAISPGGRAPYLRALNDRFPSWAESTRRIYEQKHRVVSPDEAIEAFFQQATFFTPEQREQVRERLSALGLSSTDELNSEARAEVQTKLKLQPEDAIDAQRLAKLFATFADLMLGLDQLVWNLWRSAAPQSSIRRDLSPAELRALVRRSLCGDAEASAVQVQQQLEMTRQLTAGLLAGLGLAGQTFGNHFHARYSPDAIRSAIDAESGGGLFASAEAKCWKRYTDLSAELTAEAIETQVRDTVVKYAEDLIRGRKR